jgi:DNA-binding GntR family transcriptional regulator
MTETITQSDAVYARLRTGILSLELAPGERISERGLEGAFGASRTPVRAALSRLDAEGLVRRDGRGWIVAPLDLAEVIHAVELREALERAAIEWGVERADDTQLARLVRIARQEWLDTDDGVRRGEEFHVELTALSGNPLLTDAVRGAVIRLARARWLEASTSEHGLQHREEHEAIAAALAARDADTAVRLAREHGRHVRDHLLDSLAGDRARGLRVTGADGALDRPRAEPRG